MCTDPDAKSFRDQLQKTLQVLIKEHEKWQLEQIAGAKCKVIIDIPGTVIPDKKQYAAKVKDLASKGQLVTKKENITPALNAGGRLREKVACNVILPATKAY